MNTTPMATISKAEVERLKYELAMALRSEKRLLEACEAGMKSNMLAGFYIDNMPVEHLNTFNEGFAKLQAATRLARKRNDS